jgi:hypothetical protein
MIDLAVSGGSDDGPGDRVKKTQRFLLQLGQERFGPASGEVEKEIRDVTDLEQLEHLVIRLFSVASWQELFESQA